MARRGRTKATPCLDLDAGGLDRMVREEFLVHDDAASTRCVGESEEGGKRGEQCSQCQGAVHAGIVGLAGDGASARRVNFAKCGPGVGWRQLLSKVSRGN
jgi:hypothetical protein